MFTTVSLVDGHSVDFGLADARANADARSCPIPVLCLRSFTGVFDSRISHEIAAK